MEPYRDEPVRFAREMLNFHPTPDQEKFLNALSTNTHVSVKSGHGTGKTAADAVIIIWFMCTRFDARVPCTAPSEDQLKNVLWAELAKWFRELDPFFQSHFVLTSEKFYHKDYERTWFAVARTARKEKPEALQGFHSGNLLFMIEEASGVAEEVFMVVRGALTDEANHCVMTSNPTRTIGFFYDSHNLWEGDPWHCLTFNGEKSPLVAARYINEIATEFGEDSDVYRVRVLGQFPVQADYTLIPKAWIMAALERQVSYHKRLASKSFDSAGVDVARYGENKTIFILVRGITVVGMLTYRKQSTMKTAEQVIALCDKMNPNDIKVDEIGIGAGVVDRAVQRGYNVTGVDVGRRAIHKEKFQNLRAEYYWELRTRFEEGSISLYPLTKTLSKTDVIQLVEQIASIRYEYNPTGKIIIWSKEKMRREGIRSPDIADGMMLAFAEYYPEELTKRPMTSLERWSKSLEEPPAEIDDGYEEYANDFYKRTKYPIDGDNVTEDMTW